jgi:hypothetical protein
MKEECGDGGGLLKKEVTKRKEDRGQSVTQDILSVSAKFTFLTCGLPAFFLLALAFMLMLSCNSQIS